VRGGEENSVKRKGRKGEEIRVQERGISSSESTFEGGGATISQGGGDGTETFALYGERVSLLFRKRKDANAIKEERVPLGEKRRENRI